ncbi:MAG: hypothetical protein Q7R85_04610 [bacterium]|nr:hypothetical protein [bacterium]
MNVVLAFVLFLIGLVAFILAIAGAHANGDPTFAADPKHKNDFGLVCLLALVAVISLFSAGYCIG